MKKKVSIIDLSIIIMSVFLVIKFSGGAKTIEEAITSSSSMPISIIHEEKTLLPIYFGLIGNDDISEVKIVESKRNIEYEAKSI